MAKGSTKADLWKLAGWRLETKMGRSLRVNMESQLLNNNNLKIIPIRARSSSLALLLIMILRYISGAARLGRPAYLFSDKKGPKGFDKFKRQNKGKSDSAPSPQSNKQPNDQDDQEKANQMEEMLKRYKKIQEIENSAAMRGSNVHRPGFNKFARKTTNSKPSDGSEKEKEKQQIEDESVHKMDEYEANENKEKQDNTQGSQKLNSKDKKPLPGFGKFHSKGKSISSQPNNKGQQIKPDSQKQETRPKPKSETKTQQEEHAFFNRKMEPQEQKEKENEQKLSPEELERLKEEKQLLQKEAFFNMKVDEFKEKKKQQKYGGSEAFNWMEMRRSWQKKFEQRTGINLSKIEPPAFVKANPVLHSLYNFLMGQKFFLALFIFFYAFSGFLTIAMLRQEEIDSSEMIKMIDSGQAKVIKFRTVEHDSGSEMGKKKQRYAIVERTMVGYKCACNEEFENFLKAKVIAHNIISPQNPIVVVENVKNQSDVMVSLHNWTPIAALLLYMLYRMASTKSKTQIKKGNPFQEASKSKRFLQPVKVRFNDVVGMQKAKEEIVEFIDFLKKPQKYHNLGARIPRGALLTGPPGTGKTLIAKACAGESGVPFFSISGSEFVEMFVGVGAQRVRDLFKEAKESAPSIIFIDQIDAVGKKRAASFGGNEERDNTLNQLLVEMDGFGSKSDVIVFAATNQKDVLDSALTRPGRFDRLIEVELPDLEGRKEIFMVHLKPIVIDSQINMVEYARRMATLTPGFSGADIKNLCNEAAIIAARNNSKFVSIHDFEMATERIIGGVEKKSSIITPETKRIVAYHECGHGVSSWFLEGANPLLKLTIIPRSKGALGFAQYLPHESQISTRQQLEDQICVILGGRMSEEVFFGKISTGAYDDLQKAYRLAKMIVTRYGMSKRLGWLNYEEGEYSKHYSHKTEQMIDEEVLQIIKECTEKTRALITSKKDLIASLAEKLLEKETIDQFTISEILGERPFKSSKQYEEYLTEHRKLAESKISSFSAYVL